MHSKSCTLSHISELAHRGPRAGGGDDSVKDMRDIDMNLWLRNFIITVAIEYCLSLKRRIIRGFHVCAWELLYEVLDIGGPVVIWYISRISVLHSLTSLHPCLATCLYNAARFYRYWRVYTLQAHKG
jgi:hypothetical protein